MVISSGFHGNLNVYRLKYVIHILYIYSIKSYYVYECVYKYIYMGIGSSDDLMEYP